MPTISSVISYFPSAKEGFTTTLSSSIASGAATVPLNSVAGYTNGDTVVLVVEPTSSTAKQAFTGVVDTSGVQITSVVWTEGTNGTHASGATVVDYVTATHMSMLTKGLLVSHNQDGTMITSLPLTTPKITTSINDSGGNEVIKTPATASAVNEITVTNAATGNNPRISATGGNTNISLDLLPKGTGHLTTNGSVLLASVFDHVVSGCVWTADSAGVNRVASMTSGVVFIGGSYLTVAAVVSRTFTASKDTYIDVSNNGDQTGLIAYDASTANNGASVALAAGSLRLGVIQTAAGSIAAAGSINQGQEDKVVPIASSIPYAVTDSLGNLICPRDPNRRVLAYRQIVADFTTTGAGTDITGLDLKFIVPTGRKVRVTGFVGNVTASVASNGGSMALLDVTGGVTLATAFTSTNASSDAGNVNPARVYTPGAATTNIKAQLSKGTNAATTHTNSSATNPSYILVELV